MPYKCKAMDCTNFANGSNGYCRMHTSRLRRVGSLNAQKMRRKPVGTLVILPKNLVRDGYCRIENCGKKAKTRTFCEKHYTYLKKHKIKMPIPVQRETNSGKTCKIDNCSVHAYAKGYCQKHYMRKLRHNNALHDKRLVTIGKRCKIVGCNFYAQIGKKYCDYHYSRLRRAKLKIRFVKILGGKCSKCGYNDSLAALTFHHISPKEKISTISSMLNDGVSLSKIKEELSKCTLLCANCHRELHDAYTKFKEYPNYLQELKCV